MEEPVYIGDEMPRWVREGVRVRVKRLPWTKDGLRIGGWSRSHDERGDYVHPGDRGTLRRRNGRGWWDWTVEFDNGGFCVLSKDRLEILAKVTGEVGRE